MKRMLFLMITATCTDAFPLKVNATEIDKLRLYSDEYPPYNFSVHNQAMGIMVDILVEMLRISNSKLTRDDIQFLPWARGLAYTRQRKNTLLFSTTKTQQRADLFQWVGPIITSELVLIAKREKKLTYQNKEALKHLRFGAVRSDVSADILFQHFGKEVDVNLSNDGQISVLQLFLGRIDLLSYEKNVAFWMLRKAGLPINDYEIIYRFAPTEEWFALNKETDKRVVTDLQVALDSLGEDYIKHVINRYIGRTE